MVVIKIIDDLIIANIDDFDSFVPILPLRLVVVNTFSYSIEASLSFQWVVDIIRNKLELHKFLDPAIPVN